MKTRMELLGEDAASRVADSLETWLDLSEQVRMISKRAIEAILLKSRNDPAWWIRTVLGKNPWEMQSGDHGIRAG